MIGGLTNKEWMLSWINAEQNLVTAILNGAYSDQERQRAEGRREQLAKMLNFVEQLED